MRQSEGDRNEGPVDASAEALVEAPGVALVEPVGEPPVGRTLVWVRRVVVGLLGAAVLTVLVGGFAWQNTGGKWQIIATPSMGQVAPVGSLVFTRPVTAEQLTVGDVITYRPPNPAYHDTITHRVIQTAGTGAATTVRTQGDINGAPDPWAIASPDLVGRVAAIGWGLGWLVKALPLLVAGGVFVWFTTRLWAPVLWRVPVRVLGFSLVLSTAVAILKPFVGVISLGSSGDPAGTHVLVVSTGLLPIRVAAETGGTADLVDGQVGMITTQLPPGVKGATLTSGVHMPVWLWALMVLLWLTPLIYGLIAGRRDYLLLEAADTARRTEPEPDESPTAELPALDTLPAHDTATPHAAGLRRRLRRPALLGVVVALVVTAMVVTTAATQAAFTAKITNSANTAATAPYFTCLAAATTIGSDFLDYPLDDATVTNTSAARDVSGNSRPGVYSTGGYTTTTNKPCPRDSPASAVTINATSTNQGYIAGPNTKLSITTFGMAIWFRTTTTTGGRLVGFGASRTGASATADRHLYMTNAGAVVFGVNPGTISTITSANGFNDGQWHLAVATQSSAGMILYLDGKQVANNSVTGGDSNGGYFRVGWDTLANYPNRPTTDYWSGSLAYVSLYGSSGIPNATSVAQYYVAGT